MADKEQGFGSQETTSGRPGRDAGREERRPPSIRGDRLRQHSRPKRRPVSTAYYKFLFTEIPLEMRQAKLKDKGTGEERALFPDGTTWLDLVVRATVQRAASGDVRAMRELRVAIEGREGVRMENLREVLDDDEVPNGRIATAMASLGAADRALIVAASNKVRTMVEAEMEEMSAAQTQRMATEPGGTEGTGPTRNC